jgi:O-methyltransferase domain/Dimerisation domain
MQIGTGFMASKTLLSAVELGVFSTLANGPADLPTLQQKLGLHPRSARDFLDALVALNLLERKNGVYSNTVEADLFLDKAKPSYVGGLLEMANARLYRFWGSLTDALRSGELQNEGKGGDDFFAAMYATPARLRDFLRAMSGLSVGPALAIAEKFDWKSHATFMDLGTAQGELPVIVAQAHPHLRGIGFDLPLVRPVFEDFVAGHKLSDRVVFKGGDFFVDTLPKTDVIVMGHILHDWDLGQKKALLGKAFEALPKGGAVIAYDPIIDDDRRTNTFSFLSSLNMLIETRAVSNIRAQIVRPGCARPAFRQPASSIWSARTPWQSGSNRPRQPTHITRTEVHDANAPSGARSNFYADPSFRRAKRASNPFTYSGDDSPLENRMR